MTRIKDNFQKICYTHNLHHFWPKIRPSSGRKSYNEAPVPTHQRNEKQVGLGVGDSTLKFKGVQYGEAKIAIFIT